MRSRVTPSNDTTRASAIRASWMIDCRDSKTATLARKGSESTASIVATVDARRAPMIPSRVAAAVIAGRAGRCSSRIAALSFREGSSSRRGIDVQGDGFGLFEQLTAGPNRQAGDLERRGRLGVQPVVSSLGALQNRLVGGKGQDIDQGE